MTKHEPLNVWDPFVSLISVNEKKLKKLVADATMRDRTGAVQTTYGRGNQLSYASVLPINRSFSLLLYSSVAFVLPDEIVTIRLRSS